MTCCQTSTQGRTRKWLDDFTPMLGVSSWKLNAIQPKLTETLTKFRNKDKCYEYHEDFGHTTLNAENSKMPTMSWLIRGN